MFTEPYVPWAVESLGRPGARVADPLRGYSFGYDHGFWSAASPLDMYSVATRSLVAALGTPFLTWLADLFA